MSCDDFNFRILAINLPIATVLNLILGVTRGAEVSQFTTRQTRPCFVARWVWTRVAHIGVDMGPRLIGTVYVHKVDKITLRSWEMLV